MEHSISSPQYLFFYAEDKVSAVCISRCPATTLAVPDFENMHSI